MSYHCYTRWLTRFPCLEASITTDEGMSIKAHPTRFAVQGNRI